MIAALFVEIGGVYDNRWPEIEAWGLPTLDARDYRGPHRVIAHPPCKRWGRYWGGGPSANWPRLKGDDRGCFAAALWAVRAFGGVLEHPEASHAWDWFGLERPLKAGGWTGLDRYGGRSCCVEQGHYGHRARKATWLYAVLPKVPELIWGPSEGVRLDAGFHSAEERARARGAHKRDSGRLTAHEALATPEPFARVLIKMVQSNGSQKRSGGE